jgi:hypothetical protein
VAEEKNTISNMSKKSSIYWYNQSAMVRKAFLYNRRDNDLLVATIPRGSIVIGTTGFVATERKVNGFNAKLTNFKPNRRCSWQGFELRCMVSPIALTGSMVKLNPRDFNYIVAEVPNIKVARKAKSLGVPVTKNLSGQKFLNLEIDCFQKQGKNRRAKLL